MRFFSITKKAIQDFIRHDAMTGSAALAFYSALSLAPLVLLFVGIAGMLSVGGQNEIIHQFNLLVGPQGAEAIKMIVENADKEEESSLLSTIVSLAVLTFSASAVFAQLQTVLNTIFEVQAKPGFGMHGWIRSRLFSIGILFSLGFVMLVSLIVSAAISMIHTGEGIIWISINTVISIVIFSLFFAAVFKYLPDVRMPWKDVWLGSLITALLFSLGKTGIGLYLGNSAVGSAYGAAGSLIVLLVWVYYSSLIIFFGAELTQVVLNSYGRGAKPNEYAVKIK